MNSDSLLFLPDAADMGVKCAVLSDSSDTNYELDVECASPLLCARFLMLTNARHFCLYVTASQTCYLVTDHLQCVMNDRNEVQLGLTFSRVSGFSLLVATAEL